MSIHAPVIRAVIDSEDIAFAAPVRWAGKSTVLPVGRGGWGLQAKSNEHKLHRAVG
jgi:hypothetical protein